MSDALRIAAERGMTVDSIQEVQTTDRASSPHARMTLNILGAALLCGLGFGAIFSIPQWVKADGPSAVERAAQGAPAGQVSTPKPPKKANRQPCPHTRLGAGEEWVPEEGYTWIDSSSPSLGVRWQPGSRHPTAANVEAAQEEGRWRATAGYVISPVGSLNAQWKPGLRHPSKPHITSATDAGFWLADDGYVFEKEGVLDVQWAASRRHRKYGHISSAVREGFWNADDGYRFISEDSLEVRWTPGVPHPNAPNVISSAKEDSWHPAKGYRFRNDRSDDLSVVKLFTITEAQAQAAIAKILGAAVAQAVGDDADTNTLGGAFQKAIAGTFRDELVRAAIRDLAPNEPQHLINATTNLVVLALDGKLTQRNWVNQTARDALGEQLAREAPNSAAAYELGEFIGRVIEARGR